MHFEDLVTAFAIIGASGFLATLVLVGIIARNAWRQHRAEQTRLTLLRGVAPPKRSER